ncbi:hypothetical protein BJ508DRAFT_2896 [Ascobolus immersus RN42]|uniref:Uncharacterized protein n=1 Tax=Ascobolus immersus RN42 TaxID=1160509 RepID=A0A3N4ITS8_ASCIM|nr:hypothetical protein BJ508DRAFT_2896 [Ascobolus immersus RN42]
MAVVSVCYLFPSVCRSKAWLVVVIILVFPSFLSILTLLSLSIFAVGPFALRKKSSIDFARFIFFVISCFTFCYIQPFDCFASYAPS